MLDIDLSTRSRDAHSWIRIRTLDIYQILIDLALQYICFSRSR